MDQEAQVVGQGEQFTDIDADAAFNEGAGVEVHPEAKDDGTDDVAAFGDDGDVGEGEEHEGPEQNQDAASSANQPDIKPPTIEELQTEISKLKKVAEDNQKFGRTEAQQKAELAKQLEELKAKIPQADPLADVPDDVKEYLELNPEARTIAEKMAEHIISQKLGGIDPATIGQQLKQVNEMAQQMSFRSALENGFTDEKGEKVQGHPDAPMVLNTPEFRAFVEAEKVNTENITAKDAIVLISKYKADKAAKGAKDHAAGKGAQARKQAQDFAGQSGGSLGTGTRPGDLSKGSGDEGSPEDWFNEGAVETAKKLAH